MLSVCLSVLRSEYRSGVRFTLQLRQWQSEVRASSGDARDSLYSSLRQTQDPVKDGMISIIQNNTSKKDGQWLSLNQSVESHCDVTV